MAIWASPDSRAPQLEWLAYNPKNLKKLDLIEAAFSRWLPHAVAHRRRFAGEKQRIRATEAAESGAAVKEFNYLQDQLGKPQVDEVWYDFDSDFYHWRGPATGNRMAMTRVKFEREILYPYYEVKTDEQK